MQAGEDVGGRAARDVGPRALAAGVERVEKAPPEFETFVSSRKDSLLRLAYLVTGGRQADAEDLLQTTLVQLYLSWARVRAASSPDAYSRRVLMNAFLSGRRRPSHRRERLVEAVVDAAGADPDPDDRLALWPHVSALPPRQRAVIVLRYYAGCDEAEIADLLGMARGTVKSTASAALASLRRRMGEEG